jgi:segregation and condensation protein A
MEYEVKLEIFEGPLDLLLHLIYKNEVDIFDIPISTITDQYLEYLEMMKAFNIDIAGDFLLMASTLMHIKSKMLLPELNDDEEEDPRVEITRPLLEYMRFKEAAGELYDRELLDRDVFVRKIPPYLEQHVEEEEPQLDVSLFQLMEAFKRIVEERLPGVQLKLKMDRWSVKEKTEEIIELLREKGSVFFRDLFDINLNISEFIVTFLAILELAHMGLVRVIQASHSSDLELTPSFDENGENGNGQTS